jgi:hypothetical protein
MDERLRRFAFIYLAVRGIIDMTLAVITYRRVGSIVPSVGFILLCGVFYCFLYFGIRNEEFYGRYGRRVILWREPFGYWFVVAFLILSHLAVTALFAFSVFAASGG